MPSGNPTFSVRFLDDGSGYVIDAIWPDHRIEQLAGLYVAPIYAQQWVIDHSGAWVDEQLKIKPTNMT